MKQVGILSLQGAFLEHQKMIETLGHKAFQIRNLSDLNICKDGLIIPGGESTTILNLLEKLNMLNPIKQEIENGLPVFGTCAGLILMAKQIEGVENKAINLMDINVKRNAYGRQTGSFYVENSMKYVGDCVPMTFIRAPYITNVANNVEVLASVDGHIVAAKQENKIVTAFHPELNRDTRIHEFFIDLM